MKPETDEWVVKAEGNWNVASRETQANDPVWDIICFLAQQCAEQYLKAFLEEHGISFRKTHDLVILLDAGAGLLVELDTMRPDLAYPGTLGIAARYPGTLADDIAANEAMRIADDVRGIIRNKLGVS